MQAEYGIDPFKNVPELYPPLVHRDIVTTLIWVYIRVTIYFRPKQEEIHVS